MIINNLFENTMPLYSSMYLTEQRGILVPSFEFRIPYDHSRNPDEGTIPDYKELNSAKCYELYLLAQEAKNEPAVVFVKFPDREGLYGICVYPTGGADWLEKYKKPAYRVTDRLDRRIVLGFCINYAAVLFDKATAIQTTYYRNLRGMNKPISGLADKDYWLIDQARNYTYKMIRDRYKRGMDNYVHTTDTRLRKAIDDYIRDPMHTRWYSPTVGGFPSKDDFLKDIREPS